MPIITPACISNGYDDEQFLPCHTGVPAQILHPRRSVIRRDYIVRMMEEFVRALAGINALKRAHEWEKARESADQELRRLFGASASELLNLSDTELRARLIAGEPTQAVRDKTLMLATLLNEAGDAATSQSREEEGNRFHQKALDLLLNVLSQGDPSELPEFAPKIELLLGALQEWNLPMGTCATVMQYYERIGEFGKAEDRFHAILAEAPADPRTIQFGMAFYRRLLSQSDESLAGGNLPRSEVEMALQELARKGS